MLTEEARDALLHLTGEHEGVYIEDNPLWNNKRKFPAAMMLMSTPSGDQVPLDDDLDAAFIALRKLVCTQHIEECSGYEQSLISGEVYYVTCDSEDCHRYEKE